MKVLKDIWDKYPMNLHIDSLVDGKFSKGTKGVIILIFLIVPFISSIISMIHVVRFLSLGNTYGVSLTLAITYEIANLTILMAVVLMKKLRAVFVWLCFIVLLIVQIIGNVYYSYDYILGQITIDKTFLDTFISFVQQIIELEDRKSVVFILSCFLGLPIPMVSLLLVKSVVDYLEIEGKEEPKKEVVEERKPETEQGKDIVAVIDESAAKTEDVKEVLEEAVVAESQPEVINTEENNPAHIGVTLRPATDDHNQ